MPRSASNSTPRAAIVTGASSGIGLAIAHVLAQEGYALTIAARRPEKLGRAADELRAHRVPVETTVANVAFEADISALVCEHRERFGRLDVLVNNAGLGVFGPLEELDTSKMDLQIAVNLRSVMLLYRESLTLLRRAGAEHRNALVVSTSSISGKAGSDHLAVYSATKHGVVGFTQAMNRELYRDGIKSCVLCPAYVDTPLSDYVKHRIPGHEMIQSSDVAESVRYLLKLTPHCVIPEMLFMRPGDGH